MMERPKKNLFSTRILLFSFSLKRGWYFYFYAPQFCLWFSLYKKVLFIRIRRKKEKSCCRCTCVCVCSVHLERWPVMLLGGTRFRFDSWKVARRRDKSQGVPDFFFFLLLFLLCQPHGDSKKMKYHVLDLNDSIGSREGSLSILTHQCLGGTRTTMGYKS